MEGKSMRNPPLMLYHHPVYEVLFSSHKYYTLQCYVIVYVVTLPTSWLPCQQHMSTYQKLLNWTQITRVVGNHTLIPRRTS